MKCSTNTLKQLAACNHLCSELCQITPHETEQLISKAEVLHYRPEEVVGHDEGVFHYILLDGICAYIDVDDSVVGLSYSGLFLHTYLITARSLSIRSLTDSIVLKISEADLQEVFPQIALTPALIRMYGEGLIDEINFARLTPPAKYKRLADKKLTDIKINYIASYMNVSVRQMLRIKKAYLHYTE
jgi:hypothetical protein